MSYDEMAEYLFKRADKFETEGHATTASVIRFLYFMYKREQNDPIVRSLDPNEPQSHEFSMAGMNIASLIKVMEREDLKS